MKTKNYKVYAVSTIVQSTLSYMFYAGFATSGLNVIIPVYSNKNGLDTTRILSLNSVASLIGVLGIIVFSSLVMRYGARKTITLAYVVAGVGGMILLAFFKSYWGYLFCAICTQFCGMGYSHGTTNGVIANWWPKQRGTILGITTLGLPIASLIITPMLSFLTGRYGLDKPVIGLGLVFVLMGVITMLALYEKPEELGFLPDNGKYGDQSVKEDFKSKWRLGLLLREKHTWLLGLAFGMQFIVIVGYTSQMVAYLMESKFTQNSALLVLSLFAVAGSVLSILVGVLDTKLGTRKASIIMVLTAVLALSVGYVGKGNHVMILVSIAILSIMEGGSANLLASYVVAVYGYENFNATYRVVYILAYIFRAFSFAIVAALIRATGAYRTAFGLLVIPAIVSLLCVLFAGDSRLEDPA